ncbi:YibE/F family protein [Pseudokineococcus sp. 1T1Z-3]|uniref:YibE/F family protein n=1 Tax=Pseudokineococcus sp. 1T1Z-3 TaxID=3132745 RepID=UPI0030AAD6A6
MPKPETTPTTSTPPPTPAPRHEQALRSSRRVVAVSAVLVGLVTASVLAGLVVLWPTQGAGVPAAGEPAAAELVSGTVTAVEPFDCDAQAFDEDGNPIPVGPCGDVSVRLAGGVVVGVQVSPTVYETGIGAGDGVQLLEGPGEGGVPSYVFVDYERGVPLALLGVVLVLLVVAVARWRGVAAVLGALISLLVLLRFVVPALLAGEDALAVAVVGSAAVAVVVLYLAHGISVRTTSALLGTLVGLVLTAGIGVWATGGARLTGTAFEDDVSLSVLAPEISLSGVVLASLVIAGLGVLNDVTVTQSSLVWELRETSPEAGRGRLFASAMRVGRDHVASSMYTLIFAYAGSALTLLLLVSVYGRPLLEVATTDEVGTEVVRTLVGAIGLVLAIPVTTGVAVLMAPAPERDVAA